MTKVANDVTMIAEYVRAFIEANSLDAGVAEELARQIVLGLPESDDAPRFKRDLARCIMEFR